MWVALFILAKQVTVPIQQSMALAEWTREVSSGQLEYPFPEQAHDSYGIRCAPLTPMTRIARDSRSQIVMFTCEACSGSVQDSSAAPPLMETVLKTSHGRYFAGRRGLHSSTDTFRFQKCFDVGSADDPLSPKGLLGPDAGSYRALSDAQILAHGVGLRE